MKRNDIETKSLNGWRNNPLLLDEGCYKHKNSHTQIVD